MVTELSIKPAHWKSVGDDGRLLLRNVRARHSRPTAGRLRSGSLLRSGRARRAAVLAREYFSVQVKSEPDAWIFEDEDSVRWLVHNGNPILLCIVNKKASQLESSIRSGDSRFRSAVSLPDSS